MFDFISRLFEDNDKRTEEIMNKAREDVARIVKENEQHEKDRQRWARENHSSEVDKHWELLTGDKGEIQSYSDGDVIHYTHSDGTPMSPSEEFQHLEDIYGSAL